MSELFRDLLHDRTVILAANRNDRPFDIGSSDAANRCPFCAGNESETPAEILAIRPNGSAADSSDWTVRLVPNRYPAVEKNADSKKQSDNSEPALGEHDVLICCPTHRTRAGDLNDDEWHDVIQIAHRRINQWRAEKRWHWATLFQNVGAAAGASLEHLHCQMLALPTVPTLPAAEIESSAAYYFSHNRCYWCDEIAALSNSSSAIEKTSVANNDRSRLVIESEKHVAFCPVASRLPYEVWILPKRHNSHFELTAQEDLADLAKLLRSVLVKLEHLMPEVAYNWWLHSAPFDGVPSAAFDSGALNHYHWHIEVIPRVATAAGFELCSGWHINSIPADQAAAKLRAIDIA